MSIEQIEKMLYDLFAEFVKIKVKIESLEMKVEYLMGHTVQTGSDPEF